MEINTVPVYKASHKQLTESILEFEKFSMRTLVYRIREMQFTESEKYIIHVYNVISALSQPAQGVRYWNPIHASWKCCMAACIQAL